MTPYQLRGKARNRLGRERFSGATLCRSASYPATEKLSSEADELPKSRSLCKLAFTWRDNRPNRGYTTSVRALSETRWLAVTIDTADSCEPPVFRLVAVGEERNEPPFGARELIAIHEELASVYGDGARSRKGIVLRIPLGSSKA